MNTFLNILCGMMHFGPDGDDGGGGDAGGTEVAETPVDAGAGQQAVPEAVDWTKDDTPLPEALAARFGSGIKFIGDLTKKFSSSSSEAQRYRSEHERTQRELEIERAVKRNLPGQKPEPDKSFFGHPNKEAYIAAVEADPIGTWNNNFKHLMKNNPDLLKELVSPIIKESIEPYENQSRQAQEQKMLNDTYVKHPEFSSGGEYRHILDKWADEGGSEVLKKAADALRGTGINAYEMIAKGVAYDLVRQQNAANKAGQVKKQASSVTANNGSGVKGKPVPANKSEEIDDLIAAEEKVSGKPMEQQAKDVMKAVWAKPDRTKRMSRR